MTIYNVHIYREMKLKFDGIEADAPEAAASIACDKPTDEADSIDDCDGETLAALVDLVGDEEYSQSEMIDFQAERLRKATPALLEALKDLLGDQPNVQDGQCVWCGRDYRDPDPEFDIQTGDCPSDDCPSSIARAAIAKATADSPPSGPAAATAVNPESPTHNTNAGASSLRTYQVSVMVQSSRTYEVQARSPREAALNYNEGDVCAESYGEELQTDCVLVSDDRKCTWAIVPKAEWQE